MNGRKMMLLAVFLVALLCGILTVLRDYVIEAADTAAEITDLRALYAAHDETDAAAEKFAAGTRPAEVVTRLHEDTRHVAIVFDGLPERPVAARLLDVLEKHHAPAVFFVEGQNAANQPETIRLIYEAGQELGNYTFVGVRAAEKLSVRRMLSELCRTQTAVAALSPQTPSLFRAPRTVYTEELLRAVSAAGISCAVKENVRCEAGSFRDADAAAAFAAAVPPGSIIAVALSRPVELPAADPVQDTAQPAVDKKPTVKDPPPVRQTPPPPNAADALDWLLTALEAAGMQVTDIHDFRKIRYIPAPLAPEGPGKGGA